MAQVFAVSLALMLSFGLQFIVIQKFHINSYFNMQPINNLTKEAGALYKKIIDYYGKSFRTFKYRALYSKIEVFL
ncbi:MAG: hypothetical protein WCH21_08830 [Bacteroidota bacterium]